MTKMQLFKKYEEQLAKKGMRRIDGITFNSNKTEIQNAIDCLECPDEQMEVFASAFEKEYPNIFRAMPKDFKTHEFNRFYIYNTVK